MRRDKPKLVLLIGSLAPDTIDLDAIRAEADAAGSLLCLWLHDDPFEIDYWPKAMLADYIFNGDRWSAVHIPHKNSHFMPFAAATKHHFRQLVPYSERRIAISYTGVGFENRRAALRMFAAGLPAASLQVFGEGWPNDMSFAKNQRLTREELSDLNSNSRITLYIQRKLNIANSRWSLDPTGPATRLFETAMSGTLQAIVADSLEPAEFFEPGSEIIFVDNARDLRLLLERTFDEPEAIEAIVRRAQTRALKQHTYTHRAQSILKIVGLDGSERDAS